jgi:cytochrome c-type biogenesis protein CcmE
MPKPIRGSVASVTGNTITVAGTDASGNTTQTAVTVNDTTKYSKLTTATPDAITQGKCVTARGTLDNGGTLQATTINLRPSVDGKCGPHGR